MDKLNEQVAGRGLRTNRNRGYRSYSSPRYTSPVVYSSLVGSTLTTRPRYTSPVVSRLTRYASPSVYSSLRSTAIPVASSIFHRNARVVARPSYLIPRNRRVVGSSLRLLSTRSEWFNQLFPSGLTTKSKISEGLAAQVSGKDKDTYWLIERITEQQFLAEWISIIDESDREDTAQTFGEEEIIQLLIDTAKPKRSLRATSRGLPAPTSKFGFGSSGVPRRTPEPSAPEREMTRSEWVAVLLPRPPGREYSVAIERLKAKYTDNWSTEEITETQFRNEWRSIIESSYIPVKP